MKAGIGLAILLILDLGPLAGAAAPADQKAVACNSAGTPFCDAGMAPIAGWNGHVFRLSQNYPASIAGDSQPWLQFDPRTQSIAYLKAALDYFFEGNLQPDAEDSFDPAKNAVRRWYNAPWQDFGMNGREFVHGLTRERVSRVRELGQGQAHRWNNYAVGYYNPAGGLAIGRVWADHEKPNAGAGTMPEGAVAAKLLFTTATVDEVPYLAGAPEWNAYIYADPNDPAPASGSRRAVMRVRLLQIDIAVKDSRVGGTTGWVFGTFVYGGGPDGPAGGSGWSNVSPVGVMWGNDPGYPGTGPLAETFLNPAVHMPHVGYQGRLNGPIDNPASSCISCHATAESPAGAMLPPAGADPAPWFRDIRSGVPFDAGRQSLDYSLQLTVGISNFRAQRKIERAAGAEADVAARPRSSEAASTTPPRDGGSTH